MELLKRCKSEITATYFACKNELMTNGYKYKSTASKTLFAATMANMAISAVAGEQTIGGLGAAITGIITEVYHASIGIVSILAAVCLVIAFIIRMTASQQKAAQATSWIVRILVCYFCIHAIGLLFDVIENTTQGMGYDAGGTTSGSGSN